ncbi:uncharacterized protein (DUF58 family) [Actinoalloteichus hoggarensis]|uniref:DUF58 domain-containing protein n=1 Tax=Actinoalloteichus hoggarensis TaxID=1470176 RepID=A0A221VYR3_9PSEU|nr:DUF58 domain-containing protein [Actinoalloteichus hoggarensis]ASO18381.1 hypothetical protein AHOG_03620 [Actinoalloteichus hoggarensis]MBB5921745.1 uncharacterized protein (DUF58 family) [Actinoalloteichus hoggarensis]
MTTAPGETARLDRLRAGLGRRTGSRWQPTDALYRGLVLGTGLICVGVLLHRLEPVLLGAPLLLSTVLALAGARPPAEQPTLWVHPPPRVGESTSAGVGIEVTGDVEWTAVRLPAARRDRPPPTAEVRPGGRRRLTAAAAALRAAVGEADETVHVLPGDGGPWRAELPRRRWGDAVELRPDHLFAGPDALLVYGPVTGVEIRRTVLPPVVALPAGPLPPRAAGLVGVHRSVQPGDGTELRDIRPFRPGDRLRRIDWRVSARSGAFDPLRGGVGWHVRERHAEADAEIVLAVDTRIDVGAEIGDWMAPSEARSTTGSLDATVRAASALAAAYLRQGDRVGLIDLGRPQLSVPCAAGRRQLLRLRGALATCARQAGWAAQPILRPRQVPAGAVLIVLSPFLDDAVVTSTGQAARRGRVFGVDVLPGPLTSDASMPWGAAVRTVLTLEHAGRLRALAEHGVRVVRWDSDGAEAMAALRGARRRGGRR